MKRNKIVLLGLLFFLKLTVSVAQVDTSFWFACPWVTPDHWWKDNVVMHISTFNTPNTVVRLRQPGITTAYPGKYDTTINIPPNTTFDYILWRKKLANSTTLGFDSLETRPANSVVPYGLYISSSANITIVYDVQTRATSYLNPETFSMKGQNGLGKEFVCPFQTKWYSVVLGGDLNGDAIVTQPHQQINIVASKPNTTVWITPKTAVVGHPANVTYSVMLPVPGSAYTVENINSNTNVAGNNLSGSVVVSDKDIAVTVTDDSVHGITGCYDLMGDQLVPVDVIGTDYILNKGYMNASEPDGGFIVGTANFTQLTINDGATITNTIINKGDTYPYHTTQPLTYVHTNIGHPVYVLDATGVGNGCELGEAILPPLNCAGSNLVAFSRNTAQSFFLNILCKNGSQSTFTLNNSTSSVSIPITAGNFTLAPGTGSLPGGPYYGAQLNLNSTATLPIDSYTIGNNTDVFAVGVLDGGSGTGGLFHYMSSFLRKTVITVPTPTPLCITGSGLTVPLTGTISGGSITGYWTTSNGSGTFGAYTSTVNTISVPYTLSNSDTLLTSLTFSLISTGCKPDTAVFTIPILQRPKVLVGSGTTICKNNVQPISLTGTVSANPIAAGGTWSTSGTGFINPGVNISYTPTPADLAAGTITFTLSSFGGCAVTSRTLAVNFINPPTLVGFDGNICTNTQSVALTCSVTGSTVSPVWTGASNLGGFFSSGNPGTSPIYTVGVSDYSLTTLNFTVSLNPGLPCLSVSDNVQLTMRPAPKAIAAGPDTVCANIGLISLNGSIAGSATSATWTTVGGSGVFVPASAPPISSYTMGFNDVTNGSITLVLNTDNGTYGCPQGTDTLRIKVLSAAQIIVNPNTAVCENAPIPLTGTVVSSNNAGIWSSTGTGAFTPNNTSLGGTYIPSLGDVATGSVVITLSANNPKCVGPAASFTATFIDAPQASFNVPALGLCLNSGISFTNNSQGNGTSFLVPPTWDFGDGFGTSTSQSPIYTYSAIGQYVVTMTVVGTNTVVFPNKDCPDVFSKTITVNPLPIPDYSYINACQGTETVFKDLSIGVGSNLQFYSWIFGDGSPNSGIKNPVHTYTAAGIYNVQLTAISFAGCSASITKAVTVNPQPHAQFGMTNDPTIALEPVYFSDFSAPTGSIASWVWSFGDESVGDGPSPTHIYMNSGQYVITLTVEDNNGCTDSITKTIDVQILPQVPTAFTPNKDNNNDLLFVKGGPFEKMLFRVYDNWGQLLFETNDQSKGWDGTYNGKDQPVGVYVWTLVVDMYNNRQVKKNGDVTIIR